MPTMRIITGTMKRIAAIGLIVSSALPGACTYQGLRMQGNGQKLAIDPEGNRRRSEI